MQLPGIYIAADEAAGRGQRLYLRLSAFRLLAILFAAVVGALAFAFPVATWLVWFVLIAFFAAALSEVLLISWQPERDWYAGRAIAESIKTLAWRFAVCAEPFSVDMPSADADKLLRERVHQVVRRGKDRLDLGGDPTVATEEMRALRRATFEERRSAYLQKRTVDQRKWYSSKARTNANNATAGRFLLLGGELLAVVLAALAIQAGRFIDFAGLVAAVVASLAAWMAIKQYSQLTSAYRVAAIELAIQEDALSTVSESEWSEAASNAEEAISREHTMWLASRGNEPIA